jgi:hypothetical protein
MMSYTPVPVDDNGVKMPDRWTELYTQREASVSTVLTAISLPVDVKEVWIHVEGSNQVLVMKGTVANSESIYLTSDGEWFSVPVCAVAGATIIYAAAPTGTVNLSILAGR